MSAHRPRLAALAAAVTAAALLVLAIPALAQETTLTGQTAEGVGVKLVVGEFGNATSFQIGKTKVECNRGGTLTTRKSTYTDFDRSDPGSFEGTFSQTNSSGGFKFKATTRIAGHVNPDGIGWRGTFKDKTVVREDGKKVDTCRLRTTWTAN